MSHRLRATRAGVTSPSTRAVSECSAGVGVGVLVTWSLQRCQFLASAVGGVCRQQRRFNPRQHGAGESRVRARARSLSDDVCVQARAASFYIFKYFVKDGNSLANVLSLIYHADQHISQHPSLADDVGAQSRTAQHLLSRLLNALNGDVEFGGQIAALALLDLPSNVFSTEFSMCFILPALAYALRSRVSAGAVHADDDNASDDDDAVASDAERDQLLLGEQLDEVAVDTLADGDFDLADGDDGTLQVVRGADDEDEDGDDGDDSDEDVAAGESNNFVAQHTTYRMRAAELADLSFYEFSGIVAVKKGAAQLAVQPDQRRRGRPSNATFAFDQRHPQAVTHCLMLKSKHDVPVLAGARVPRHPGPRRRDPAWRRAAKAFAEYVIVLHVPWVLDTGLPPIPLTFNALLRHVRALATSPSFVDRARLFWMRCLAQVSKIACVALC